VIALGDGAALSPDSSQVIYASDAGLQRVDLSTGAVSQLQDTGKNDRGVLWSPDGTRIAFTRGPSSGLIGGPGPYSLVIANPDGSNQYHLLENADANTAQAWLPDGSALLYTVAGPEGASVRTISIQSGVVDSLFEINYPYATVALSPDGRRVAYEAMLPGDQYAIFVSNLDGSNSRLVVNTMPIVTTVPHWSPDGQWLILSVHDEALAGGSQMPVLALVEVDTCQVVPLTSLHGYVSGWNQ
jgi:Tol biopolymer transport system component